MPYLGIQTQPTPTTYTFHEFPSCTGPSRYETATHQTLANGPAKVLLPSRCKTHCNPSDPVSKSGYHSNAPAFQTSGLHTSPDWGWSKSVKVKGCPVSRANSSPVSCSSPSRFRLTRGRPPRNPTPASDRLSHPRRLSWESIERGSPKIFWSPRSSSRMELADTVGCLIQDRTRLWQQCGLQPNLWAGPYIYGKFSTPAST